MKFRVVYGTRTGLLLLLLLLLAALFGDADVVDTLPLSLSVLLQISVSVPCPCPQLVQRRLEARSNLVQIGHLTDY